MSRFNRLSHVIWCYKYYNVWVLKYRFWILKGRVASEVYKTIQAYCGRMNTEVIELIVQLDHVHLIVSMPPKESISKLLGMVKGKTAIQVFRQFPYLKEKPYWGNHFEARGYCVDTVGIDEQSYVSMLNFKKEKKLVKRALNLTKVIFVGITLAAFLEGYY